MYFIYPWILWIYKTCVRINLFELVIFIFVFRKNSERELDQSKLKLLKIYSDCCANLTFDNIQLTVLSTQNVISLRKIGLLRELRRLLRQWSEVVATGSLIHLIIFKFPRHREIRSPGFQRRGSWSKHVCTPPCLSLLKHKATSTESRGAHHNHR